MFKKPTLRQRGYDHTPMQLINKLEALNEKRIKTTVVESAMSLFY